MLTIILIYLGLTLIIILIGVWVVGRELKSLPEKTSGYVERTDDEIVAAWEKWLKEVPDPDKKFLIFGLRFLSAREFVQAIKDGDKEIRDLAIGTSRILAKELGTDPVEEIIS